MSLLWIVMIGEVLLYCNIVLTLSLDLFSLIHWSFHSMIQHTIIEREWPRVSWWDLLTFGILHVCPLILTLSPMISSHLDISLSTSSCHVLLPTIEPHPSFCTSTAPATPLWTLRPILVQFSPQIYRLQQWQHSRYDIVGEQHHILEYHLGFQQNPPQSIDLLKSWLQRMTGTLLECFWALPLLILISFQAITNQKESGGV